MDPIQLMGGEREVILRLLAATLIGAALGFNRELKDKPAGLRTHALVGLGSALVTVTSIQLAYTGGHLDGSAVTRVIQGIITGIGFLGGGVIFRSPEQGTVQGLTTAASIWIVAALGMSCGAGHWVTALVALGLTLAVLVAGIPIERWIHRVHHGHDLDDKSKRPPTNPSGH
jgi:putative Mg2+ transporter-C (MgtC) family protein